MALKLSAQNEVNNYISVYRDWEAPLQRSQWGIDE